jgi:hypothetical protein
MSNVQVYNLGYWMFRVGRSTFAFWTGQHDQRQYSVVYGLWTVDVFYYLGPLTYTLNYE